MSIILKDLKKEYHLADGTLVRAVNGISLEIPSNTIYGIIGKSGAGKSTLLRILSGFFEADTGSIMLDDIDLKTNRIAYLRRIGYVQEIRGLRISFHDQKIIYLQDISGHDTFPA